jgi:hypothetical protein
MHDNKSWPDMTYDELHFFVGIYLIYFSVNIYMSTTEKVE